MIQSAENIDYKETFSPISTKDSFCVVIALIAHFDLELHQMDVKISILKGDLYENVYMDQPNGFVKNDMNHMVCKLNRSIYGLNRPQGSGM